MILELSKYGRFQHKHLDDTHCGIKEECVQKMNAIPHLFEPCNCSNGLGAISWTLTETHQNQASATKPFACSVQDYEPHTIN
jgi:hypothetical protein